MSLDVQTKIQNRNTLFCTKDTQRMLSNNCDWSRLSFKSDKNNFHKNLKQTFFLVQCTKSTCLVSLAFSTDITAILRHISTTDKRRFIISSFERLNNMINFPKKICKHGFEKTVDEGKIRIFNSHVVQ